MIKLLPVLFIVIYGLVSQYPSTDEIAKDRPEDAGKGDERSQYEFLIGVSDKYEEIHDRCDAGEENDPGYPHKAKVRGNPCEEPDISAAQAVFLADDLE